MASASSGRLAARSPEEQEGGRSLAQPPPLGSGAPRPAAPERFAAGRAGTAEMPWAPAGEAALPPPGSIRAMNPISSGEQPSRPAEIARLASHPRTRPPWLKLPPSPKRRTSAAAPSRRASSSGSRDFRAAAGGAEPAIGRLSTVCRLRISARSDAPRPCRRGPSIRYTVSNIACPAATGAGHGIMQTLRKISTRRGGR
jgi:hypothetical protein